jgi:hypothetical protein
LSTEKGKGRGNGEGGEGEVIREEEGEGRGRRVHTTPEASFTASPSSKTSINTWAESSPYLHMQRRPKEVAEGERRKKEEGGGRRKEEEEGGGGEGGGREHIQLQRHPSRPLHQAKP